MLSLDEARKLFPITEKHIYLAIAAANPGASPVSFSVNLFFEELQSGKGAMEHWHKKVSETKANISELIHCDPDELCFIKNTSEGLNIAAQGIPLNPGENVIVDDLENPNNIYPWMNLKRTKGIEVKMIRSKKCRLDIKDIVSAIDPKTRVISISHVTSYFGFRNNLTELSKVCKERGIYLVDDGMQAVGVIETDVKKLGIDVLACGGHKGLLGPFGTGFLYLNRHTCKDISPTYLAWSSVNGGSEFPYDGIAYPDARRFEIGNSNYPGIYGLNEGIKLILNLGIKNIEERVLQLTDFLIQKLQEANFDINSSLKKNERSGIVSFNVADPMRFQRLLRERNIIVNVRRGAIRVAPHFYNTEDEIQTFVDCLIEITARHY
jgi:selenocysteine lyase/cysteine desulfurase